MTDYNIGPGVAAMIEQSGDEPRSDEQYVVMDEGHQISRTFGRDAIYYYYQEDNRTQRCPFR